MALYGMCGDRAHMKKTTTTRKRGDARTLQRVPTQTPRMKGTGVPEPEL